MNTLVGQTLGKYQVQEQLGQGGMAVVYRAHQPTLARDVAIKVLHSHLAQTDDFLQRFKREASAVARLRHPHIVQVHDFDVEADLHYMVLEYIAGPTLQTVLAQRQEQEQDFSFAEIQQIFLPLVDAVTYAHQLGVIHRDLKPANIMFTPSGQVVLTDFGIARLMDGQQLTLTGTVSGTPGYMAPEQGEGEAGNERSDVYALGVILYELLTGCVPFEADTPVAVLMKHLVEPVPPPSQIKSDFPAAIETVMLKALSKAQEDRFQTAADFGQALEAAIAETNQVARPIASISPPPEKEARASPVPSALHLTCFNGFQASCAGQEVAEFRSIKGRVLLTYLATEREQPHRREMLAGLLWPDEREAKARRNLSQTLLELRQTIGDHTAEPPFFQITHQTIEFNPESDHWIDVVAFMEKLSDVRQHDHPGLAECQACIRTLIAIVDLYQGPFLAGFSAVDSDLLETWILTQREALQQQALDALTTLSQHYEQQQAYSEAQRFTRRYLELVPWHEEAHQQLMRLLALSGQRSAALAQYEVCCRLLDEELDVPPAPETTVLYEQIRNGKLSPAPQPLHSPAPPHAPTQQRPFQAQTPPAHFVGREAEVAQLRTGLTQHDGPVYAIVGMGGLGKTTLAMQVAQALREDFADGVLWANAATGSSMDILANWGSAYGYDFSNIADLENRAAAVRGILTERQTLIVIDNIVAAAEVRPLLPGSETCAVLLTTRDLDLAHTLNAETLLLGELSTENARQLLVHILGEDRVVREEEATLEICALLQNLPLAVEIVAQRLKSRPRQKLARMAVRLQAMTHRLGLEISDQAVRASFEVSWEALSDELRHFFPCLAVFEGRSFQADAVAYLADLDPLDAEDLLDTLVALSLVKEEGDTQYRQHPLLADFAREKLTEAETIYGRMSDYYLDFSQVHREDYAALQPEWENIVGAIEAVYRQERWKIIIDYTDALNEPWYIRGRYTDACRAYEWTDEAAQHLNDEAALATNQFRWGKAKFEQGDFDEAKKLMTKALAWYQQIDDLPSVAQTHYQLAKISLNGGSLDEAQALLVSSLSIYSQLGDVPGIADTLYLQAFRYYVLHQFKEAQHVAQEALDLQEGLEKKIDMVPTLSILAQTIAALEQYDLALPYGHRAVELSEKLNNKVSLAESLYVLTIIYRQEGNLELARRYGEQSLTLNQQMGIRQTEAQLLHQLSIIHQKMAQYPQAFNLGMESLKIFQTVPDKLSHAVVLRHLGRLHSDLDQTEKARDFWEKALHLAQSINISALAESIEEALESIKRF